MFSWSSDAHSQKRAGTLAALQETGLAKAVSEYKNFRAGMQQWMHGAPFSFCFAHSPRVTSFIEVPSQLTNGRADHKFGGKNPLAECHLGMVQSFKKHLHASLANLFLIDTDS